jgi:hypothetical protein
MNIRLKTPGTADGHSARIICIRFGLPDGDADAGLKVGVDENASGRDAHDAEADPKDYCADPPVTRLSKYNTASLMALGDRDTSPRV